MVLTKKRKAVILARIELEAADLIPQIYDVIDGVNRAVVVHALIQTLGIMVSEIDDARVFNGMVDSIPAQIRKTAAQFRTILDDLREEAGDDDDDGGDDDFSMQIHPKGNA